MRAIRPALLCAFLFTLPLLAEHPDIPQLEYAEQPLHSGADIHVCVGIDANVNFNTVMGAQRTAARLFSRIGIHVRWVCRHSTDEADREIGIRVADHTDPDRLKGALAFALPYARKRVRVTIFYDRVEEVQRGRDCFGLLLGHTLAHELAHVLKAEDTHSSDGIMRPHWDEADFKAMRAGSLTFSPEDVRAIHRNLSSFYPPETVAPEGALKITSVDTSNCMPAAVSCSHAGN